MDLTKTKEMTFREAWFAMLNGKKVKLPQWKGYWAFENGTIMMHCRDGSVTDIRKTENVAYTFTNIAERIWEIYEEPGLVMEKDGLYISVENCKTPVFVSPGEINRANFVSPGEMPPDAREGV